MQYTQCKEAETSWVVPWLIYDQKLWAIIWRHLTLFYTQSIILTYFMVPSIRQKINDGCVKPKHRIVECYAGHQTLQDTFQTISFMQWWWHLYYDTGYTQQCCMKWFFTLANQKNRVRDRVSKALKVRKSTNSLCRKWMQDPLLPAMQEIQMHVPCFDDNF